MHRGVNRTILGGFTKRNVSLGGSGNYDSTSVNSGLFLMFYRTSKSDIKCFSSISSMEMTWVERIESCRNFKVDFHSIVGVVKAIVFMHS